MHFVFLVTLLTQLKEAETHRGLAHCPEPRTRRPSGGRDGGREGFKTGIFALLCFGRFDQNAKERERERLDEKV